MATSMINYTGKIHIGYHTGVEGKSPARANCNQNVVMSREISAEKMAAAEEHQFCGRCFPKGEAGSRKEAATLWLARVS